MANNKLINFSKQILAQLEGDENKAIALKNSRKANAAVKGHVSALEAQLVDSEDNLEEAQQALELAKYPKEAIPSGADSSKAYVETILESQNVVDDVEEEIECIKDTIKYLKDFLKEHQF